jgi:hypothetical protein
MSLELVLLVEPVDQPRYFDSLPSVGWEAIIQLWVGKPLKLLAGKPSITSGAGGLFSLAGKPSATFWTGTPFFQLVAEKPAAKFGVGNPFGLGSPLN